MAFSWGNYDALEGAAASPSSLVTGLGLGPPAPSSALSENGQVASGPRTRHAAVEGFYPFSLSALNGGEPRHKAASWSATRTAEVSAPGFMGLGASPPLSAPPSLPPKGGGCAHLLAHPHAVGWTP